jgi:hypothetical protein
MQCAGQQSDKRTFSRSVFSAENGASAILGNKGNVGENIWLMLSVRKGQV